MSFRNHLQMGGFDQTMALVLYRRTNDWMGDGHLDIRVAEHLFVARLNHLPDDQFELIYSEGRSYDIKIILEPRHGTVAHAQFEQWEKDGSARSFYKELRGIKGGRAYISTMHKPWPDLRREVPKIGGGGAVARGYPYVVEWRHIGEAV